MRRLSGFDQEWLWMELAHAIRRKRPLPEVLGELSSANGRTRRGRITGQLAEAMGQGRALSESVAAVEKAFSLGTVAAIEAGERVGNLPDVLKTLGENVCMERDFQSRIGGIVAYPLLVASAALAVFALIDVMIFPMFYQMFVELGIRLPALTLIAPAFLQVEALVVFFLPAALLILLYVIPAGCLPFRTLMDALRIRLPLIGGVVRRQLLARWCWSKGMLIEAGVAEPLALSLAGQSTGNASVARTSEIIGKRVASGEPLSEALGASSFFPGPLVWMVNMAEKASGHRHVWRVASDLYREQAETASRIFLAVLRLGFVVLCVQIVGMAVVAMFLPLIQLMNSMGG